MPPPEDVAPEVTPAARHPPEQPRRTTSARADAYRARSRPSSRQILRQALSSADAARQAVLLREVLGPPVALRTGVGDHPS